MPERFDCPECGTDVMVTGFTLRAEQTKSYMRFCGAGPVLIASTEMASDRSECLVCAARLPWKPVDLMRAA